MSGPLAPGAPGLTPRGAAWPPPRLGRGCAGLGARRARPPSTLQLGAWGSRPWTREASWPTDACAAAPWRDGGWAGQAFPGGSRQSGLRGGSRRRASEESVAVHVESDLT